MAFRRPALSGPTGDLLTALHDLHVRAGEPSAAMIAHGLGISRNTVHLVFTQPRVPRYGAFSAVVGRLCQLTGEDPAPYSRLWRSARQAELRAGDNAGSDGAQRGSASGEVTELLEPGAALSIGQQAAEKDPLTNVQATRNFADTYAALAGNIGRVLHGKPEQIRLALTCLLAGGHLLLEDMPGTGKTTLAKAIATSMAGTYRRIQFTPDLIPNDITGTAMYNQRSTTYEFSTGPVFANVVLADEINRASPKAQAALLEVMEEEQVTVDGHIHPVPQPFIVVATQNPIDIQGTFRLPEAQLDRFLMRIAIGYADQSFEKAILLDHFTNGPAPALAAVADLAQIRWMIAYARQVHVAPSILSYVSAISQTTRSHSQLRLGVSIRGSLALVRGAKVWAACEGREYVTPEDIKTIAPHVLAHRMLLEPEAELRGTHIQDILSQVLVSTLVPSQ